MNKMLRFLALVFAARHASSTSERLSHANKRVLNLNITDNNYATFVCHDNN